LLGDTASHDFLMKTEPETEDYCFEKGKRDQHLIQVPHLLSVEWNTAKSLWKFGASRSTASIQRCVSREISMSDDVNVLFGTLKWVLQGREGMEIFPRIMYGI
jgi:hypothetical protein